jgi:hypothetical protein
MARGNQREQSREKAQVKQQAKLKQQGKVRFSGRYKIEFLLHVSNLPSIAILSCLIYRAEIPRLETKVMPVLSRPKLPPKRPGNY